MFTTSLTLRMAKNSKNEIHQNDTKKGKQIRALVLYSDEMTAIELKTTRKLETELFKPFPRHHRFQRNTFTIRFKLVMQTESDEKYFEELSTMRVHRLQKEPLHILSEQRRIDRSIEESALRNYKGFIQAAHCMQESKQIVGGLLQRIDNDGDDTEALKTVSHNFTKISRNIRHHQKIFNGLQQTLESVQNVLEIPKLMDSCIRMKMFDEAIDLKSHCEQLLLRNSDLHILQAVKADTEKVSLKMRSILLKQLEAEENTLTELLALMSHLRRLELFTDAELRVEFLKRRELWMWSSINVQDLLDCKLSSSDAYLCASKVFDFSRTFVFDTITQYNAIFVDDSGIKDIALLHWIEERIEFLLQVLEISLSLITEGKLMGNLMRQTMACGYSLGRIGVDFRCLLPPLFEIRILQLFERISETTVEDSLRSLKNNQWMISEEELKKLDLSTEHDGQVQVYLKIILRFPPLAVFLDGFISSCNELT